jgi:hypothetical protein
MTFARLSDLPNIGLGLASVTLGAIGLGMFFLPVLGIPISLAGLVAGIAGAAIAAGGKSCDMRLALIGIGLCSLAVSVDWAMTYAPSGFLAPSDAGPRLPIVPAVQKAQPPPPARFHGERPNIMSVPATSLI